MYVQCSNVQLYSFNSCNSMKTDHFNEMARWKSCNSNKLSVSYCDG